VRTHLPRVMLLFAASIVPCNAGVMRAQALPTLAPTPQVRGVRNLRVFDANKKFVGTVLSVPYGAGESATVAIRVRGYIVVFDVDKNGFIADTLGPLLFQSSDCSGTPYVPSTFPAALVQPKAVVGPPGKTVYIPDPNGDPTQRITIQSDSTGSGDCKPAQCGDPCTGFVPALPLLDLDTVYTPPFSVR
jgi:hypothetical protein